MDFGNLIAYQIFKVHFVVCDVSYNTWDKDLFDTKR